MGEIDNDNDTAVDSRPISPEKTITSRRSAPWAALLAVTLPIVAITGGLIWYLYARPIALFAHAGPVPASASSPPSERADSPFLKQARDAQVVTCAPVYDSLSLTAVAGADFMAQALWNETEAKDRTLQGVAGMTYKAGSYAGPAASVVFTAPTGKKCEGIMVRVVPFQQSCEAVTALLPKNTTQSRKLADVAFHTSGDSDLQVMLIPAGIGCTAITVVRGRSR
ncbi:MAG: hypothetical protein BGN99_10215 [Alphaproteobacteria bacterium 65-37]|jgi:hypothetical protein|nr:hypothetical protein [Alphaproteobacteria bacterium]OJU41048.1 MAG: hypothetical protein BGN99_10215 [Alphaproteobacteria bacterium 65-37]